MIKWVCSIEEDAPQMLFLTEKCTSLQDVNATPSFLGFLTPTVLQTLGALTKISWCEFVHT